MDSHHSDAHVVVAYFGRKKREVRLIAGREYRVEPLNPLKMANRGRACIFLGYGNGGARVRFLDSGRTGTVDDVDLLESGVANPDTVERVERREEMARVWNTARPLTSLSDGEIAPGTLLELLKKAEVLGRLTEVVAARWISEETAIELGFAGTQAYARSFRLIVRLFDVKGEPVALQGVRSDAVATGSVGFTSMPRGIYSAGLLYANTLGQRVLRGEAPTLPSILVADNVQVFLMLAGATKAPGVEIALVGVPGGGSDSVLGDVAWPKGTELLVHAPPKLLNARVRRVRRAVKPTPVAPITEVLGFPTPQVQ